MEIFRLADVRVDASVEQLLSDVQDEVRAFGELGEFSPDVQLELHRSFLPERISDTLNIESVRVNPRLTRAVLDGLAISETDRYSEQEILNVSSANELIESEATDRSPLSPPFLRELHRRIEDKLISEAGAFRTQDVQITGASHTPPAWSDVPDLVRDVADQLDQAGGQVDSVVAAVWAHATIAKIHPFVDGNGRTARMVQDFLLLCAGLLPVGIPINRRAEYYEALESADGGDFSSVVRIVAAAELVALDKARRIALAPERRRSRIKQLVRAASTTVKRTNYNQYELWRRSVDGFVAEMVTWIDEINAESSDLGLKARKHEILSFEKWCEVRNEGRSSNTWVLEIDVEVGGKVSLRSLFYARRHVLEWVTDSDDSRKDQVGLFMTSVPDRDTRWDFRRYSDSYISFREAVFDVGGPVFYQDPQAGAITLPEGVSVSLEKPPAWEPGAIASADAIELLIEQMLTKLGLLDT